MIIVNTDSSILFGHIDDFLWIRCSGRGSFANSPLVKDIAEPFINDGGRFVIIDLEVCVGVDSTFMGTLAGIARRLIPLGGSVQIASPTDRARAALEGLGLDALLDIEPPSAPWRGHLDQIRNHLQPAVLGDAPLRGVEQTRHVLDSHLTLSELSEDNAAKFKMVTECLRKELDKHSDES